MRALLLALIPIGFVAAQDPVPALLAVSRDARLASYGGSPGIRELDIFGPSTPVAARGGS